ncbi:hypothetical protein [Leptospira interrogans]|nr:hypothetical protein [Leptospira interrogans]MCH1887315.1 hypothetical protein [Leptospira interrogans]
MKLNLAFMIVLQVGGNSANTSPYPQVDGVGTKFYRGFAVIPTDLY